MTKDKQSEFQKAFRVLENKSYFRLKKHEKSFVDKFLKSDIDAWSFIPHPTVIKALTKNEISRYIVVIETLRSGIYKNINEFLEKATVNINAYYTGGAADFLCDVFLREEDYKSFYDKLIQKLQDAGSGEIEETPNKLVSIFKVNDFLVSSRKLISAIKQPDSDIIDEISKDQISFELALRDYLSPECKKHFGSEEKIKKYLTKLEDQNVILGYKVVYDFSKHLDLQYVPLCQATKQIPIILRRNKKEIGEFMESLIELIEVTPTHPADQADREVTHICINDYEVPNKRNIWRKSFYKLAGTSVNLYSYPIEGVVNETPVNISELPELNKILEQYPATGAFIGTLSSPLIPIDSHNIYLSKESFLFHGVTLGDSGTGKTTTDIVLAINALNVINNVIILDNSGGLRAKEGYFRASAKNNYKFISIPEDSTKNSIRKIIEGQISLPGIKIFEVPKGIYPKIFDHFLDIIISTSEKHKDGEAREIDNLLLIEEANDAFGITNRKEKINQFKEVISKSSRKGWSIWLSTQRPSSFGSSPQEILELMGYLQNRLIHNISVKEEREYIIQSFQSLKTFNENKLASMLTDVPAFHVVFQGTRNNKNTCISLSPISLHIIEPKKDN